MSNIIPRGSTIPTNKKKTFTTTDDYQKGLDVKVYEGERPLVKNNHLLNSFKLEGIPPAKRGVPQIEVSFHIDENSILNVQAKELSTGKTEQITIEGNKNRLSQDQINKLIKDAERNKANDDKIRDRVNARQAFESYISSLKSASEGENFEQKAGAEKAGKLKDAISEEKAWLDANPEAEKEDLDNHLENLKGIADPIISSLYGKQGGDNNEQ